MGECFRNFSVSLIWARMPIKHWSNLRDDFFRLLPVGSIFTCYKVTEDSLSALELQRQKKIIFFKTVPWPYVSTWKMHHVKIFDVSRSLIYFPRQGWANHRQDWNLYWCNWKWIVSRTSDARQILLAKSLRPSLITNTGKHKCAAMKNLLLYKWLALRYSGWLPS